VHTPHLQVMAAFPRIESQRHMAAVFSRRMVGFMFYGDDDCHETEKPYHNLTLRLTQALLKVRFYLAARRRLVRKVNVLHKLLKMEPCGALTECDLDIDHVEERAEDEADPEDDEKDETELRNELRVGTKLIHSIDMEIRYERAENSKVHHAIFEIIMGAQTGRSALMKKCLLRFCAIADPISTECAEYLGRLHLRTPAFFLQSDMTGFIAENAPASHKLYAYTSNPPLRLDFDPASHELYAYVEKRIHSAYLQDATAVMELLQVLCLDQLNEHARLHIHRLLMERFTTITNQENGLINSGAGKCAVTVKWPTVDKEKPFGTADNTPAYEDITWKLLNLPTDSTGYGDVVTPKLANILHGLSKQHQMAQRQLPIDALLPAYKCLLDDNFVEASEKDPYLHVTRMVIEPLYSIFKRGFGLFVEQILKVYGCELGFGCASRWSDRRTVATSICELAADGNKLAVNICCTTLLQDHDYLVCQVALDYACHLLGQQWRELEHPRVNDILSALLTCAFDPRKFLREICHNARVDLDYDEPKLAHLQSIVVEGLSKELPAYPPKLRRRVLKDLETAGNSQPKLRDAIFRRIIVGIKEEAVCESLVQAKLDAASNTLRFARQEQAVHHQL